MGTRAPCRCVRRRRRVQLGIRVQDRTRVRTRPPRGGIEVRSARSAFVISALLCLSNPAISAALDGSSDESRPSGVLGHTIIRVYGAVIPEVQDYDLDHPGWGTGLAVSYGVARAVSLSLELAYYRFQRFA